MPTPLTSYKTLTHDERHLKGVGLVAASSDAGITADDLIEAERIAKNTIDSWIIMLAGATRGAAIIDAFEAGDLDDLPGDIGDLADLHASAVVWGWYQRRNTSNVQRSEAPEDIQQKIVDMAVALAQRIQTSGKIRSPDGSILRIRMGPPGPAVGGPMASGSMFDDRGFMTHPDGSTRRIPHRHPLDDQG